MKIEKYKGGRNWAIYDEDGELIAVTVYKKGAKSVESRLTEKQQIQEKGESKCKQQSS